MKRALLQSAQTALRGVPRVVVALGLVSLLTDVAAGIAHSLMPLFLVSTLGMSVATLGVVEGVATALPRAIHAASGAWSDRARNRKRLLVLGYGLAALAKVVLALAPTASWAVAARWSDRVGKGLRGAPRDALIADVTPPAQLGIAYGWRHSLDRVGALLGPLLALLFMQWSGGELRAVFWFACLPATLGLVLLVRALRGVTSAPPAAQEGRERPEPWRARRGRWLLAIGGALALAQFSDAFLLLRAQDAGMPQAYVPAMLVVLHAVSMVAVAGGFLSDRVGRLGLLTCGIAALVGADVVLALAHGPLAALCGAALWGLHIGLTQGIVPALLAESAPAHARGWAFGRYSLVQGAAALVTNALAGWLWVSAGPRVLFFAAAACAGAALVLLVPFSRSTGAFSPGE